MKRVEGKPLGKPVVTKSPLRYPGGKTRAVKSLAALLPPGFDPNGGVTLSPFLGGGSFELFLTGMGHHVVGADGFAPLATFWFVLLSDPSGLADKLEGELFPADKSMFYAARGRLKEGLGKGSCLLKSEAGVAVSTQDVLQVAADFYVVNRCSFSGATLSGGFSAAAAEGRYTQSSVERIRDFRNHRLSVHYSDFQGFLCRQEHDGSQHVQFVFCDPPYMLEGAANSLYGANGDMHKGFDHETLYKILDTRFKKIPWMVTYNDTPAVRKLYGKYFVSDASWTYGMNASKKSSEIVVTNYPV